MLVLDTVLYAFLAWYLGQVMPSDAGVRKPWYFLFEPAYWGFGAGRAAAKASAKVADEAAAAEGMRAARGASLDACPTELVDRHSAGDPTVVVQNLRKTFGAFKAVQGIDLELFEGQIFSLLGHNGAGKTTTINMLTGLFEPDSASGNTTVYGKSIVNDLAHARAHLGICPQHDVGRPLVSVAGRSFSFIFEHK
jgi:ATP-binding cassette subfamily A (ABC1) protein 3